MKFLRALLILLLIFSTKLVLCQDFVTELVFEDALGNFDTLEVGYDQNGTLGIDTSLGEENIIQTIRDSIFDIRVTDEQLKRVQNKGATFHTKRQILTNPCDTSWKNIISIDIKALNWPVKMYWNDDFLDDCVDSSWITTFPIGGWCDVVCQVMVRERVYSNIKQIQINKPFTFDDDWCGYIDGNDSIVYLILALYDKGGGCSIIGIDKVEDIHIEIYPNPAKDEITVEFEQFREKSSFSLFNIKGERVLEIEIHSNISKVDVSQISSGHYFYSIENQGKQFQKGRLVILE